ncbi:MAG: hypothetical protein ACRDCW_16205 [Sarcina sp.]
MSNTGDRRFKKREIYNEKSKLNELRKEEQKVEHKFEGSKNTNK